MSAEKSGRLNAVQVRTRFDISPPRKRYWTAVLMNGGSLAVPRLLAELWTVEKLVRPMF